MEERRTKRVGWLPTVTVILEGMLMIEKHYWSSFFHGSNLIAWLSQKQKVVALSSCEAEYIAATSAACQGIWLARLLGDLKAHKTNKFKLLVDNKSAISLSKNPVHHDRSKHIDTRYHFIRECVESEKVDIEHVETKEQLADILTKARIKFVEMRKKLGMVEVKKERQQQD